MVQDHARLLISIPPKYAIAEVVGYLNGTSAIAVARQFSVLGSQFSVFGSQFLVFGSRSFRPDARI